jgi:DNA-binding NtrC family response regulator
MSYRGIAGFEGRIGSAATRVRTAPRSDDHQNSSRGTKFHCNGVYLRAIIGASFTRYSKDHIRSFRREGLRSPAYLLARLLEARRHLWVGLSSQIISSPARGLGVLPMENLVRHFRDVQGLAKLVGKSPALLKTIEQLPAIAESEAPVLIVGETGTGKELVARALHYLSKRAAFPFVPVNCGALSETLFEDELFGHTRGAFTDAHVRRDGLIAHAEGGTLLLDEVDTLAPKAQIDLLRVLQEKTFRLVGCSTEQQANVRIIAASNAPIDQLVKSGRFRADLYYRLCIFFIALIPLRDRKEDIAVLTDHFLQKHTPAARVTPKLTSGARAAIMACDWPGNIRELENAIIRGIHLTKADSIGIEELGLIPATDTLCSTPALPPTQNRGFGTMKRAVVEKFERDYLTHLMSEHQGNVSQAARTAGKDRREFGKLLRRHRIEPKLFRLPTSPPAGELR